MCMFFTKKTLKEIKDTDKNTPCLGTKRLTRYKCQFPQVDLEI